MGLSKLKSPAFYTRIASAIVALAIVYLLFAFFSLNGLKVLCLVAVIVGTWELIKILFHPDDPIRTKTFFYILNVFLFIISANFIELSASVFASVSVIYISASLWLHKRFEDLSSFSNFASRSILGFLYIGLLPAFACGLLDLKHGLIWFLTLLAVVFAGDSFAYIFGILWGNKKLMPEISPKKTLIGSVGGLIGSASAALICSSFLPDMSYFLVAILGFITGAIGQMGDLFESMLKRVADVKDSGSIMPGHGGILDRLDGVLFASPVFFIGALLLERMYLS